MRACRGGTYCPPALPFARPPSPLPRVDAKTYSGEVPWQPGTANVPTAIEPGPLAFFTPEEAAFIDAAVGRLIPADALGPGAKEAGVTQFLDRQLSGPYGAAQTWYMQGPWRDGEPTQGYQTRLIGRSWVRAAWCAATGLAKT
ncbi:MAG: gluconate 2-dehydrogenase subunit 3 family protein [Alphaproteobacteria bacterium]|nr:gluconate 2-dehydrogenase subunit 3 family protein [Alphaproteobacteria bacterium]